MKKIILILLALPFLTSLSPKTTENLVGEWVGKEPGKATTMAIIFDSEGYFYFKQNEEIQGGKKFKLRDKMVSTTYVLDKTTLPYQLDLIITHLDSGEKDVGLGIINFVNEDTIEIAIGDKNIRPVAFLEGELIVFNRLKK